MGSLSRMVCPWWKPCGNMQVVGDSDGTTGVFPKMRNTPCELTRRPQKDNIEIHEKFAAQQDGSYFLLRDIAIASKLVKQYRYNDIGCVLQN